MKDSQSQTEKECPRCRSAKVRRTNVVLTPGRPTPDAPRAATTRTTSFLCKECSHAWDDARTV